MKALSASDRSCACRRVACGLTCGCVDAVELISQLLLLLRQRCARLKQGGVHAEMVRPDRNLGLKVHRVLELWLLLQYMRDACSLTVRTLCASSRLLKCGQRCGCNKFKCISVAAWLSVCRRNSRLPPLGSNSLAYRYSSRSYTRVQMSSVALARVDLSQNQCILTARV